MELFPDSRPIEKEPLGPEAVGPLRPTEKQAPGAWGTEAKLLGREPGLMNGPFF